ncbi:hypothetical protein WJX84_004963 [Apatococcus fuscideae]|uniref:F-box/LRR-repeat protein 14 n=1 Tax=Apatococcus fuscideae TaxID=2026836 RepID=A0AAW1TCU4_9CHLO
MHGTGVQDSGHLQLPARAGRDRKRTRLAKTESSCWGKLPGALLQNSFPSLNRPQTFSKILAGMSQLERLDLTGCKEQELYLMPLMRLLQTLSSLSLSGIGYLNGHDWDWIGHLTQLTHLNVSETYYLNDRNIIRLETLTQLRELDLSFNVHIKGKPLSQFQALTSISLQRCESICAEGLQSLADVPDLASLCLHTAFQHSEKSRQALLKMQKLQHLDLSKAIGFTVAQMRDLAGLPLLTSLILQDVRGNDAVGPRALLAAVQNGQRLRLLDVSGHDGLDTHVLDALSTLTNLQELHLRSSGPAEGPGDSISRLTKLTLLAAKHCPWARDSTVDSWSTLQCLQTLLLSYNLGIGDASLCSIGRFTTLEHLELCSCANLTGKGFRHLTSLQRLQHLRLRALPATKGMLGHVAKLRALKLLDLTSCKSLDSRCLIPLADLVPCISPRM